MKSTLQQFVETVIDVTLVIGVCLMVIAAVNEMATGPAELDTAELVALDARFAPSEARKQARAEVLAQAAERSVHPSASQPPRRRHPSTITESTE